MRRTVATAVKESLCEEILRLQIQGCEYVRFKDLEFQIGTYTINCRTPFCANGFHSYEERVAWDYLREHYAYDKFNLAEYHGNSKSFKITNVQVQRMITLQNLLN